MTSNALFYNAQNGDRVYDADSFESFVRAFFNSGVSRNGGGLRVSPAGGLKVSVAPGLANCNGKVGVFPLAQEFTLSPNGGSSARTDLVVCRRDDSARDITVNVRQGADTPVTSGVYEVVLAKVTVNPGAVTLTESDISDGDGSGRVDITMAVPEDAITGFEQQFNAWFQTVQSMLGEDEAGQLAIAIQAAQARADEAYTLAGTANTAAGNAQTSADQASNLRCRLLQDYTASWTDSGAIQQPALLVSENDITAYSPSTVTLGGRTQTNRRDFAVVLLRRDWNADSPVTAVVLRRGETAVAVDIANGKYYSRVLRWNLNPYALEFRNEGITKSGRNVAPSKTFEPGIMVSWAQTGMNVNNAANNFEEYTQYNSTLTTLSQCIQRNSNAAVRNALHNIYLLPVAVYLFHGVGSD